jgi:hypothetical protein
LNCYLYWLFKDVRNRTELTSFFENALLRGLNNAWLAYLAWKMARLCDITAYSEVVRDGLAGGGVTKK